MRLQFIMMTMILGFISQSESALARAPLFPHCDTPSTTIGPCTTLVINYSSDADYSIATTYKSCETGENVTVHSLMGGECPSRDRLGPYTYRDVLVGSELKMGPVGTATTTYNVRNATAKADMISFLCSGWMMFSAKCVPK